MEEQSDKTFIKNFSLIVVALVLFTFIIVFLAKSVGFKEEEDIPSRTALTEERIRPVADVYMSEDHNVAAEEETPPAVTPATAVAVDSGVDAEKIYQSVCAACHSTGILDSPKPGSAEMAQRAEKGMDAMLQNALNGLNAMPPRGGRADLSDEQVKAVIEYMLK